MRIAVERRNVAGLASLPAGLRFWHPAALIATAGGLGLLPRAPGTWGSLAALPAAWFIHAGFGPGGLALAALAVFLAGWWAASVYTAASADRDPAPVVIDEVAGQWLVLVAASGDPVLYVAGFVLFRFLDIVKPWPASWADRALGGGLGVMLDDIFAGGYGAIALYIIVIAMGGG